MAETLIAWDVAKVSESVYRTVIITSERILVGNVSGSVLSSHPALRFDKRAWNSKSFTDTVAASGLDLKHLDAITLSDVVSMTHNSLANTFSVVHADSGKTLSTNITVRYGERDHFLSVLKKALPQCEHRTSAVSVASTYFQILSNWSWVTWPALFGLIAGVCGVWSNGSEQSGPSSVLNTPSMSGLRENGHLTKQQRYEVLVALVFGGLGAAIGIKGSLLLISGCCAILVVPLVVAKMNPAVLHEFRRTSQAMGTE